jgi:ubiquinone/menaquinone biosynthesis C-methylase UbiE
MPSDTLDYSFDDRVAVRYDALRGHPPEVSAEIGRVIVREAGPNATLLEPGVGTGRIALPVVAAGGRVVGVDVAPMMLRALLVQPRGEGPGALDLVRCDVSRLPFRAGVFDAVVCVHVLHLIEDWRALLARLLEVLRPGGRLILGRDWIDPESFAGRIRNLFRFAVVELGEGISAPPGARAFVDALIDRGAEAEDEGRERTAVEWRTELTPRQVLDGIRSKDDAESWVLPDPLLERVMARLDAEAAALWPDIDAPQPVRRRFVYSVLRAPSG